MRDGEGEKKERKNLRRSFFPLHSLSFTLSCAPIVTTGANTPLYSPLSAPQRKLPPTEGLQALVGRRRSENCVKRRRSCRPCRLWRQNEPQRSLRWQKRRSWKPSGRRPQLWKGILALETAQGAVGVLALCALCSASCALRRAAAVFQSRGRVRYCLRFKARWLCCTAAAGLCWQQCGRRSERRFPSPGRLGAGARPLYVFKGGKDGVAAVGSGGSGAAVCEE